MTPQPTPVQTYVSQYDAIIKTMTGYLDGVREGKSELMRPVFHRAATFFGHYPGGVMDGPIEPLFDWVDQNGPAPDMESRFATLQILGKIAYVHLELEGLSGRLAGTGVSMSDVFTLMLTDEGWKIVQKAFHWHM
jgi:Putative lumazine-binding